ncbi:lytic transglycosylase domain-containing protein [Maritimibacter dapengensis]|uniref:Lytic transglycosylase domain-containing protein n=1 Tax=Maritimibacter dapengensis TaxID=2836868 RepID=A0ABS6T175_9RHOB|nr:lytic transglycosylase domain-containing protein [Maritimibacter dapengensis]MBV7378983.1 lytic transglycosylase domain-containing protein [Maritimibacter dapengensis]
MRGKLVTLLGAIGLIAGVLALPAAAQETDATGEAEAFTFKRMSAPTPGSNRRITVQIDPEEQARRLAAANAAALELARAREASVAEAEERAEAHAKAAAEQSAQAGEVTEVSAKSPDGQKPEPLPFTWFWNEVAPELDKGGPENLARALSLMDTQTEIAPPRLQSLQDIAQAHGPEILMATIGTDISPAFVLALISVESSGKPKAVSEKGAQGLMQLIPATAARFGVEDATDPIQNIKGGVAYLAWLMKEFDRDPILALAGYNAGENAVADHGGVPPYAETRAYVPKVLNAWRVARGLCLTPPQLMTDGCVFAVNGT